MHATLYGLMVFICDNMVALFLLTIFPKIYKWLQYHVSDGETAIFNGIFSFAYGSHAYIV